MFFRGSGGAGRRGMQGRGHIRRARTESGPGGAQGARDCFALVCPRHEASCSFSEKSRGLVFSKILPSRATFSKILLTLFDDQESEAAIRFLDPQLYVIVMLKRTPF